MIGIFGTPVTPDLVNSEGLDILEGVYIIDIQKGMGAEKAGLKEEDIITFVDDIKIKSFSNLTGYLESKHPGDKVNVEYYRNGKVNNTVITLNVINQTNFLRMTLQNISKEEKEKKNLKYGLRVLDSGDYMTELNPDSVLLEVNDNPL